jgi:hypothetical protein
MDTPQDTDTRMRLTDHLRTWAETEHERLTARGIRVAYTLGRADRSPRSAWIDFETDTRMARFIVWTSGMAETQAYDLTFDENDGLVFVGSNELNSQAGLDGCLADIERTLT